MFFQRNRALKVFRSKLFYWITIPAFLTGSIIIAWFLSFKDIYVFPNHNNFDYWSYTDINSGGNSRILSEIITDSLIRLEFQISDKINNPYIGLTIAPKGSETINLEHYNQLTIRLSGSEINGAAIALITVDPLKTRDKGIQEYMHYHIFQIQPGMNTYRLKVDNFKMPDWWREYNRIEDASALSPVLKHLKAINISSAFTPVTGQIQSTQIDSIIFSRNNKAIVTGIAMAEIAFLLIVFITICRTEKIKENSKRITITYKPVESNSIVPAKPDFIVFINTNFQNSDLSLEFVSNQTRVSQRRLTNEIQTRFGCNFKSYVNRLRINESKRLLLEKDLNIGEIAYKVGFNNQSHFNRVFKSELHISPTEYRKKHKPDTSI